MKIVFCNIVWMKKYKGITDSDKPKYCGEYVSEQNAGSDIFNFSEYNGKCYGYVLQEGDLVLPGQSAGDQNPDSDHKDDSDPDKDSTIDDYLVVWCAGKDKNSMRIVGWYKNAVLYKKEQYQPSFTNPEYELDYFFEADSKDCVLLPESKRVFKMERAEKSGKGRGFGRGNVWFADSPYAQTELVPEVVKYIESYDGPRENFVLTDEMIHALPEAAPGAAREELVKNGLRFFEEENYLAALQWFNAARQMKESMDVVYFTAYCLYHLAAFDQALLLLGKCLQANPDIPSVIELVAFCSDMIGDWEKTMEYLEKLNALTRDEDAKKEIQNTLLEMHAFLDE